jgi:hypothetical protein
MSMDKHDVYEPPCPQCGGPVNKNDTDRATVYADSWWHLVCLQRYVDDEGLEMTDGLLDALHV